MNTQSLKAVIDSLQAIKKFLHHPSFIDLHSHRDELKMWKILLNDTNLLLHPKESFLEIISPKLEIEPYLYLAIIEEKNFSEDEILNTGFELDYIFMICTKKIISVMSSKQKRKVMEYVKERMQNGDIWTFYRYCSAFHKLIKLKEVGEEDLFFFFKDPSFYSQSVNIADDIIRDIMKIISEWNINEIKVLLEKISKSSSHFVYLLWSKIVFSEKFSRSVMEEIAMQSGFKEIDRIYRCKETKHNMSGGIH